MGKCRFFSTPIGNVLHSVRPARIYDGCKKIDGLEEIFFKGGYFYHQKPPRVLIPPQGFDDVGSRQTNGAALFGRAVARPPVFENTQYCRFYWVVALSDQGR